MLGNFKYSNPTKLYFGGDSLNNLKEELAGYGKNVQLVYGGGSIKKNGIYDQVVAVLKECGKEIFEDGGDVYKRQIKYWLSTDIPFACTVA